MSCRVSTGCVYRLSWCQWYVGMRKKEKEKKRFKALELSTTVVRLELLSAFVLKQDPYGYVPFLFQSTELPRKTRTLAAVLHLACETISLSARRRRIPSHALLLGVCRRVARRAFTNQPRKAVFAVVCSSRLLKLCLLSTKQRDK